MIGMTRAETGNDKDFNTHCSKIYPIVILSNPKTHYSQLTTHSSSLIVAPVAVPRPSDGIKGMLFDSSG